MSENSDCDGNTWVRVTTDPSQDNAQGTDAITRCNGSMICGNPGITHRQPIGKPRRLRPAHSCHSIATT